MNLISKVKNTLWNRFTTSFLYGDYRRCWRLVKYYGIAGLKYLLPWHFYLDFIEIPITTRCNLRCPGCANLMPLYDKPYDIDREMVINSIRKISECFDVCGNFRLLGGEPFLHPELKRFIAAIPSEKCKRVSIPTNAMIVPQDPELYHLLRLKNVTVVIGNYPTATASQQQLIARLEKEKVSYEISNQDAWIDYGKAIAHNRSKAELKKQFRQCNLRSKSLLNGFVYYCPRHAHGFDLGIVERKNSESVDLLHNSSSQNRRQLRRLMWRRKPIEACKYCLRGTDRATNISRGK